MRMTLPCLNDKENAIIAHRLQNISGKMPKSLTNFKISWRLNAEQLTPSQM
jgi:hypothetical protein